MKRIIQELRCFQLFILTMDLLFVVLLSLFGAGIILSLCIKVHLSNNYSKERAEFDKMIGKGAKTDEEREPSENDPLVASV